MGTVSTIHHEIERLEQQLTETVSESQQLYIKGKLRELYASLD